MNSAAKIVIRKSASGQYVGGFASQTGNGQIVVDLGRWYRSQMTYRPFRCAMAAAESVAARFNSRTVSLYTTTPPEIQEREAREWATRVGFPQSR